MGSNTVHLAVVDARRGGHPWPAYSERTVLRLAERVDRHGRLSDDGVDALITAVAAARDAARRLAARDMLAFATSAVRDATNSAELLDRVHAETGVRLRLLTGEEEARLTFLAVRRWYGWSAGRLLVLDIGGGSLEIAAGIDEEPELAFSLPLGAGRLTRERMEGDPPSRERIEDLVRYVQRSLDPVVATVAGSGWERAVATSKTFRSLARLAGAAPSAAGIRVDRTLTTTGLSQVLGFIRHIPATALAGMGGVGAGRAGQLLAGGVVADVAMHRFGIGSLAICPWALREGVILRHLDALTGSGDATG